ncbi:GNAT family N-acetyltransferase [Mumia sp. Pv 4-285]|uniref:GNAT family N-acetyltransferase n=1 Tax=Mumia qirimensis TaxID=3234852 RepID=UPI00351CB9F9
MTVLAGPGPRRTGAGESRIRRGSADDLEAMERFLAELSPESLYLRFLTGMSSGSLPGLAKHLLTPSALGGSLLAVRGDVVIGHAMWAPIPDTHSAAGVAATVEIAVVVADASQGHGVGSRLVDELAVCVARLGTQNVQAVISAENHVVRRMITSRVGDAHYVRDGLLLTITAGVGAIAVTQPAYGAA